MRYFPLSPYFFPFLSVSLIFSLFLSTCFLFCFFFVLFLPVSPCFFLFLPVSYCFSHFFLFSPHLLLFLLGSSLLIFVFLCISRFMISRDSVYLCNKCFSLKLYNSFLEVDTLKTFMRQCEIKDIKLYQVRTKIIALG